MVHWEKNCAIDMSLSAGELWASLSRPRQVYGLDFGPIALPSCHIHEYIFHCQRVMESHNLAKSLTKLFARARGYLRPLLFLSASTWLASLIYCIVFAARLSRAGKAVWV